MLYQQIFKTALGELGLLSQKTAGKHLAEVTLLQVLGGCFSAFRQRSSAKVLGEPGPAPRRV